MVESAVPEAAQGGSASAHDAVRQMLQEIMQRHHWRAPQLAKALGKPGFIVRRWLRGERRVSVEELVEIAQVGGCSLDNLFGITPQNQTSESDSEAAEVLRSDLTRVLSEVLITLGESLGTDSSPASGRDGAGVDGRGSGSNSHPPEAR